MWNGCVRNFQTYIPIKLILERIHYVPMSSPKNSDYQIAGTYKDLIHNEMIFIRKHREKIISNAKVMYNQKASNDTTAGYVKSALDFKALEVLCDEYKKSKEVLNHVLPDCKEL